MSNAKHVSQDTTHQTVYVLLVLQAAFTIHQISVQVAVHPSLTEVTNVIYPDAAHLIQLAAYPALLPSLKEVIPVLLISA